MSDFTAAELADMRQTQADHMMDTCVQQALSTSQDGWGEPVASYADGSTLDCSFNSLAELGSSSEEVRTRDGRTVKIDAKLRLPITATVNTTDRFRVTKRHGATLAPALTFAVLGEPQRTASAILVNLEKVST